MKNDLISIILPVYNAEMYLSKCVDSILSQTYEDIELIIIDDGSIDRTAEICDYYKKVDSRITVLHIENAGVSHARNCGLEVANGEYIAFCDADDIVMCNAYELMFNCIKKQDTDMVCTLYKTVLGQEQEESGKCSRELNREETVDEILLNDDYAGYLWNKLFKHSIIEQQSALRFDENLSILEDELFVLEYIIRGEKTSFLDVVTYFYRANEGSALHQSVNERKLSIVNALEEILILLEKNGASQKVRRKIWNYMMRTYVSKYRGLLKSKASYRWKWMKLIKQKVHQFDKRYRIDKSWSFRDRMWYYMMVLLW